MAYLVGFFSLEIQAFTNRLGLPSFSHYAHIGLLFPPNGNPLFPPLHLGLHFSLLYIHPSISAYQSIHHLSILVHSNSPVHRSIQGGCYEFEGGGGGEKRIVRGY